MIYMTHTVEHEINLMPLSRQLKKLFQHLSLPLRLFQYLQMDQTKNTAYINAYTFGYMVYFHAFDTNYVHSLRVPKNNLYETKNRHVESTRGHTALSFS